MHLHKHLPHFSTIWKTDVVYFITTCTYHRLAVLDNELSANILISEWKDSLDRHGWLVGAYVIMPDHVHFFCSPAVGKEGIISKELPAFMRQWKQWTSKRIIQKYPEGANILPHHIWQQGYFDHLLRSEESYIQKWEYVRQNPVRKNLALRVDDWQWKGEIYDLRM